MPEIQIAGGGPAGAAAAIAALTEGAPVHIFEKSRAPRHKVCGEFLSPEACHVLEDLGVWQDFLRRNPARLRRCVLRFGSHSKQWSLREPAFSLSRLELDRMLLNRALRLGAVLSRGESFQQREPPAAEAIILAHGRHGNSPADRRLFGFKAHFEGAADDAVELHFSRSGYIGISPVENRLTNVCGIAPEDLLRRYGFDFDEFVRSEPVLAGRLRPLSRRMPWLAVGPLMFDRISGRAPAAQRTYAAGDALGFVDPFTGSGILNALLTGRMAGRAAARRISAGDHFRDCQALLRRPFAVSSIFRALLRARLSALAMLVPGDWLYRLTHAAVTGTR